MLHLWNLLKTGVLAFFIAGAVVFPIVESYYLSRVILSAGLMGIVYGFESVLRIGHITNCGALSGNCSEHSVRIYALVIWAGLFAYLTWRSSNSIEPKKAEFDSEK